MFHSRPINTLDGVEEFYHKYINVLKLPKGKTLEVALNYFQIKDMKINLFDLLTFFEEQQVFSNFTKSRKDYFEVYLKEHKTNKTIKFSDLGEGEQLILTLKSVINKYKLSNTLYLLDEPDAFIHPKNIELLVDLINNENNQVVITSHSPKLMSRIEDGVAIKFEKGFSPIIVDKQYGRRIDYLYEDTMGFSRYPKKILEKINEINSMIEENLIKEAKEKTKDLSKYLGENDTEIIKLSTRIFFKELSEND